jgi:hypothetical protein
MKEVRYELISVVVVVLSAVVHKMSHSHLTPYPEVKAAGASMHTYAHIVSKFTYSWHE